jgi:phosphate transport system permease protein
MMEVGPGNTAVSLRASREVLDARPFLARPISQRLFIWGARGLLLAGLLVLVALVGGIFVDGIERIDWQFFMNFPSRRAEQAGIRAAWVGSVWLLVLTVAIALPLGVGAAVYLEEYGRKGWFTQMIEICIANLAGVPSVIYGLLGLQVFVRALGFGRSVLAGACTLALLVLPIIILASREALRSVPKGLREGALALGATRWQTTWTQVLPVALPGIATGCILSFSRAIGETAPLITLGALTYVAQVPDSVFSPFTALPIQAFNWLSRPQTEFHVNAAAAITVLLFFMIVMNLAAILIRMRYQKRQR